MSALVEGGAFKCYIHPTNKKGDQPFQTESVAEWNKHCSTHEGHTEEGTTTCRDCEDIIEFTGLPFQKIIETGKKAGSKDIQLLCEECQGKIQNSKVKVKTIMKKAELDKALASSSSVVSKKQNGSASTTAESKK